ncbi:MAG: glycosyltransferase family 39 protein, partial [Chloroflexi bacterium]|nr:glycosyltransferase family 39 protein [Chloroflexota bacterium]
MKRSRRNGVAVDFPAVLQRGDFLQALKANFLDYAQYLARYSSVAVAVAFILAYVATALLRIGHPFELEWMEGGSVDHVRRALDAERLYVAPSLDFTPFIYPPLYYYVAAAFSTVMGAGFEALRLVSFLSSLGSFLLIFLIIKHETNSKAAAILGAGLFAATYQLGGTWFDIARVDSLHLLLMLGGIYTLRFHRSERAYLLAGLLIALSYFTKQSAMSVMLPLIAYALITDWQKAVYFMGSLGVVAVGGTFLLDALHDGWFSFYIFDLPQQHTIVPHFYLAFWTEDLLKPLPIAIVMAALYLFSQGAKPDKSRFLFYGLLTVGIVGGAWYSRLHSGGWFNVLIPMYALISILFGLAAHSAVQFFKPEPDRNKKVGEVLLG